MMSYSKSAVAVMAAGLLFASVGYGGGTNGAGPQDNAPDSQATEPSAGGAAPEAGGYAPPNQELAVPPKAAQFDDATLNKFADAYLDLQAIRIDYTSRLQATEDEAKAEQLQQEASEEMLKALQDNELQVKQYNQIAMALQTDPKLREKVAQMVSETKRQ